AGAGHRLVGIDDDAPDGVDLVQGVEGHDHLDGGAVGVGDNPPVPADIPDVDLRHDQRHGLVHAPGGAVIDDHGAGPGGHGRKVPALVGPGGKQGDIHALKRVGRGFLHLDFPVTDRQLLARRAVRGE
ncbi:MAG: hypothetical protein UU16_C0005G0026, partial [Candidatus Woesebacteria bacterium GW2011_GWA2_40_7]